MIEWIKIINSPNTIPELIELKKCKYCEFTEFYTKTDMIQMKDGWAPVKYFICKRCGHGVVWNYSIHKNTLLLKETIVDTRSFEDGFKDEILMVGDDADKYGTSINYWIRLGKSTPINACDMCGRIFNDALMAWDEIWNELRCPECGTNHRKIAKTLFCLNCTEFENNRCKSHMPTFNKIITHLNKTGEILPCKFFR